MKEEAKRDKIRNSQESDPAERPRLQKFIASAGLCSRRKAEEWIAEGKVTLNGSPAELGTRVNPATDDVRVKGRPVRPRNAPHSTLIVNKPRGYSCSNEDPHAESLVFDLLPRRFSKIRLFCAGRLDKDSEGLVVLTDDGSLAHRLTHPSGDVTKIYRLELSHPLDREHIPLLEAGKKVEGEFLQIDKVRPQKSNKENPRRVEVVMGHGRKREIRRLFAALGYRVVRLRRVRVGGVSLRNLSLGSARELTSKEIDLLFE